MDNVCYCQVKSGQKLFMLYYVQLFKTFMQEGASQYTTIDINFRDLEALLNFFRCNGPHLTKYKRNRKYLK